jgi:hypothetical protein
MKTKGIEKVLVTGGVGFIGSHTLDLDGAPPTSSKKH